MHGDLHTQKRNSPDVIDITMDAMTSQVRKMDNGRLGTIFNFSTQGGQVGARQVQSSY